jgi:branched-chain amino acid transport system substrate-binding protein
MNITRHLLLTGFRILVLAMVSLSAHAATKVAVIVPLTGVLAAAGKEIEGNTRAWVGRMNARPGGVAVDLLVLDDKSSADGARDAARQAVAQGAAVVLNCFGSVSCWAIAQELKSTGVSLVGAIAGDDRLRGADMPHVFTTRAGARDEVDTILRYLADLRLPDLVVIYQDDGFGQSYKRALDDVLKARPDLKLVSMLPLDVARKDYPGVAKLAIAKPSMSVVLLTNTLHSIGVIEAMKEAGYRGIYFNLAAQANPLFIERIGKLTADNKLVAAFVTMTPSPALPSAGLDAYRDTLARHGKGTTPTYLGLESYMNAALLGAVLVKDGQPSAEKMALLLGKDLVGTEIVGLPVRFDPVRRQALRWLNLSVVSRDGRVRSY